MSEKDISEILVRYRNTKKIFVSLIRIKTQISFID